MCGKTSEEIEFERDKAIEAASKELNEDVKMIDSFLRIALP